MKSLNLFKALIASALVAAGTVVATAQISLAITEVYSAGSGNGTYAADWFEITNFSNAAIDLTGWKIDDNSQSPGGAQLLRGVTSIAAGQSIIFLESNASGSNDASIGSNFKSAWFGATVPAYLTLGFYNGSGVGLSTSPSDQVNLYSSSNALQADLWFGAATAGRTFDNTFSVNNNGVLPGGVAFTNLSVAGVNNAFLSFNGAETGSPGQIPEPSTYALVAGFGALGLAALRRKRLETA